MEPVYVHCFPAEDAPKRTLADMIATLDDRAGIHRCKARDLRQQAANADLDASKFEAEAAAMRDALELLTGSREWPPKEGA